ncbi:MAG: hypothetical protein JNM17_29380 [Archangium sp.]|nr:hypothetical protein [Archangium sp.]
MRLFLIIVIILVAPAASAQCTMDTECKGDRVCEAGQCVAPKPGTTSAGAIDAPPPPPPPLVGTDNGPGLGRYSDKQLLTRPRHWAGGAGVIGIIGSIAVAGLAIPATIPTLVGTLFGGLAVVTAAITGALVIAGSGSARRAGVAGAPGARVTGLILYVATIVVGAAMAGAGIFITVPSPLILGVAALGVGGLLLLTIDAFVASGQANALPEAPRTVRPRATVVPLLSMVPTTTGSLAPTVGVGVVF